jgi:hypothetical protein
MLRSLRFYWATINTVILGYKIEPVTLLSLNVSLGTLRNNLLATAGALVFCSGFLNQFE